LSIHLKSLAFTRRGENGWTAGPYDFSRGITVLEGPNGAGKTPMLKGIAYCLGHPISLPPDVLIRCKSIILELEDAGAVITVERTIHLDFSAVVSQKDVEDRQFDNVRNFSAYLSELFGLSERSFATRSSGISAFYMSFLVPLFWVDQDTGWKDLYNALQSQNFLKDQFEEMVRLLLSLPGQNRASDKNEYTAALIRSESAKQRADIKHEVVLSLDKSLLELGAKLTVDELTQRKEAISNELRARSSVLEVIAAQSSASDEKLNQLRRERDKATFAFNSAVQRLEDLSSYGKTLETQVAIVETNEVAADTFRILCGNTACGFFRSPEESYGRRVLYIKDQIKDFESSMSLLQKDRDRLQGTVVESEELLRRELQQRQTQAESAAGDQIVSDVDRLTREFARLSSQLLQTERYEMENAELKKLIDLTIISEDAANNLRPVRGKSRDDSAAWDAANELGALFNSWLTTLSTPNLPKQIWFEQNFSLMLGGIRFTEDAAFGGSTRTRIVLAFHAALVELSLKMGGSHPRFLVLDTPKQHELHSADLKAFVHRYLQLAATYSGDLQLVIAATELEFLEGATGEHIWHPYFSVAGKPRFFGQLLPWYESAYSENQDAGSAPEILP
jgi:hypothetical protein